MSPDAPTTSDPLYEPTFIAFIYATWAGTHWLLGQWIGLFVLVFATGALTIFALREHRAHEPRPFIVDFGVVLLFCAAAIALGVLVVTGITTEPAVFFGVLCLGAAAVLVGLVLHDSLRT